jgi:polysaccharide deacetylase family protein (PEP-CTERM system associated)
LLRPLTTQPILGHRAPYFSINERSLWALDVLAEKGFAYDSSFFPTRNMLYGYPGAPRFPTRLAGPAREGGDRDAGRNLGLVEFPVSTARWLGINWPVGGGFYVRTLPYALIRAAISQLNRQGQPAIMYMHPWELDTGQRFSRVTLRERVTHYYGRRGLKRKLERMFEDFAFVPLGRLLETVVT